MSAAAVRTEELPARETLAHVRAQITGAEHIRYPYDHWILDCAMPGAMMDRIMALPFAPPEAPQFVGKREANNSTRVYFSPDMQARFPVCAEVASVYRDPRIVGALEKLTGAPLSHGRLRIEYCQDTDGFWLEPHVDIAVKLITMLVYLSPEPELADSGTDVYEPGAGHRRVATAPFAKGKGLIFVPGINTWHGFSRRPIRGIRKSLIVNLVTPEWRDVYELA